MAEYLAMGGYAAFVWTTWLGTAAVLILNIITARRYSRRLVERLRLRQARMPKRSTKA